MSRGEKDKRRRGGEELRRDEEGEKSIGEQQIV